MKKHSLLVLCTAVLLSLLLVAGCTSATFTSPSPTAIQTSVQSTDRLLTISYIDVGQGDSILIQTPSGKNMLIDAGESFAEQAIASYLQSRGVQKIDVLVATHPHADHIGGMEYIVKNFEIGDIYMPKVTTTTKTYEDLLMAIQQKGLSIHSAKAGASINIDDTLAVNILAPVGTKYDNLNDYSVVIKMTYQKNSFLFMGDASEVSEVEILESKIEDVDSDVLKIGHHGSATSSSKKFLQAVTPKYAVISVGEGNSYGHPTQATLDRLKAIGATIYRTDKDGTVVISSDGQNIAVNK